MPSAGAATSSCCCSHAEWRRPKPRPPSLKAAFEQERVGAALPPYLGISVGVAPVSPEEGLRAAIREADSQMYGDKISESGV